MQRSRTFTHVPRKLALRTTEPQLFVPPHKRREANKPDSALKRVWNALKQRKWQIMLMVLLGLVTGLFITLATPVTYRATAQLQIAPENTSEEKPLFLANHYELLKSRLLARKVIDSLGLSADTTTQDVQEKTTKRLLTQLVDGARKLIDGDNTSAESVLGKLPPEERFLAALTIEPVPNSTLVKIHYDSAEPIMAERTANEITTQFMAMVLNQNADTTTTSDEVKGIVTGQLNEAKSALDKSEAALAKYATEKEIIAANGAPDPAADRLAQLETAVTEAEKARIDTESLYAQSRSGETVQFLTDNPAIRTLQDTYTKQQADYQEKLKFYKPEYPEMLTIQEQMNISKQQIETGIKTARDEVKAKYLAAQQKEATLRKELGQQKGKLLDIREKTVTYNTLQREVETNRSVYEGLLQNIKNANSVTNITKSKISIIDSAILPYSQFSPNINLNLGLGVMLGLLTGIILAFLREHFDDRLNNRDTLENLLTLPVLGVIPHTKSMKPSVALQASNPATSEAFSSLRTNLMFAINLDTNPIIHVTSATAGEGKTDVCINLAHSFAQSGKKVLLVDCNLRKPSLHQKLDIDNSEGLSNFLNDELNVNQLIRTTHIPNVHIIPSGSRIANSVELLLNSRMSELLEATIREFDIIILDSPPVMDIADAMILSHWANVTLLVAAHAQSREKSVLDAYHKLRYTRSLVLGSILTKVRGEHGNFQQYHYYRHPAGEKIKLTNQITQDA
jgi:capsular exopolysaccharide synthesis family protein